MSGRPEHRGDLLLGARPATAAAMYAACAALCWAGSAPFVPDARAAVPLALLGAVPLGRSLLAVLAARRARAARTRLRLLLQHLCAATTSGRSPETALAEAMPAMARLFGSSTAFCRALRRSVLVLEAGRPFAEAVRSLPSALPCPEAGPVFQALASGRILGPRLVDLLRASLDLATERALLEQEAASQTSARRVEALALAGMPFLSAFALQAAAPGFFDAAAADPRGRLAMGAVYLVSVGAAALALRIVSEAPRATERRSRPLKGRRAAAPDGAPGSGPIQPPATPPAWIPDAYLRALRLAFSRNGDDPETALARHLAGKPVRLAAGVVAFALPVLLSGAGPPLVLAAAFAGAGVLSALHDRDARAAQLERDRARIASYPMFLGLSVALLSAGYVPLRALEVAREGLGNAGDAVAQDLDRTLARIRGGRTPADALEALALECGVPEIAAALSLLAQVDRRGGATTIGLLRLQASACWALARAETRRRLDEVGTKLLLPTAVDLAAVLAVAAIPALLALQMPA